MVKKALKRLWKDSCSVYVQAKEKNSVTKRTEFSENILFENEPCKLSFETLATTTQGNVSSVVQNVKLFLDNELVVPPGAKIVIKRGNRTFVYKRSGEAGVFTNHQEIPLELFESWS